MTQYYIIEIQKHTDGEYGHIVHWAADEDPVKARNKAESKYHEVLAAAAISDLPMHSAVLIHSNAMPVYYQCYEHDDVIPGEAEA